MKQYLMSVHGTHGEALPAPDVMQQMFDDVAKFNQELVSSGTWVFGGGLTDPGDATVVRAEHGEIMLTDGPYVETKEHLGGFTVVDVPDDEAARYWAGRLAVSLNWPQEVHRFPSGVAEIIERQRQEGE
jgi:hypothetical protein